MARHGGMFLRLRKSLRYIGCDLSIYSSLNRLDLAERCIWLFRVRTKFIGCPVLWARKKERVV